MQIYIFTYIYTYIYVVDELSWTHVTIKNKSEIIYMRTTLKSGMKHTQYIGSTWQVFILSSRQDEGGRGGGEGASYISKRDDVMEFMINQTSISMVCIYIKTYIVISLYDILDHIFAKKFHWYIAWYVYL